MSEKSEATAFKHPTSVVCKLGRDGGACVTAHLGYHLVFQKGFSNAHDALTCAGELFGQTFEDPKEEHHDEEIDF